MKKFLKFLGIGLGVFLLLLILLPILFKDKIATEVKKAMDENLDAQVLFNPEDVSLSLISSFPRFTFSVRNFGIINKAPFEGDTLVFAESFETGIDLLSVIGGGQIRIRKITLDKASIHVFILADGRANYNITRPSPPAEEKKPAEATAFSLRIDSWELKDLNLDYVDASSGTMAAVHGLNHEGSGDFTQDLVDLKTKTTIKDLSATFDSVNYLRHRTFNSELAMAWNQKEMKGSFGENFVELNAFRFGFSGDLNLGGEKPEFNLKFNSPQSDLKGLISLIPAVFTKGFGDLKAEGKMQFEGHLKGTYDSLSLPDFGFALKVEQGKIQYPNLPKNIEKLNLDLKLNHAQGSLELLQTNLKNFSFQLGSNPFAASGTVVGVTAPAVDVKAKGALNLAEILSAFPVEGLDLRGLLNLDILAKGQYNPAASQFPTLRADLALKQGYAKTKDFPEALEGLEFNLSASNPDGKPASTAVDLRALHFAMAGEPFDVKAIVRNLDNITYDVAAKGGIDLEKITKIFPIEGMTLTGKVKADLKTSGNMADVDAKRYDKLPTAGTVELAGFTYSSSDLKKPISISTALARFNSKEMNLETMKMTIGESDFQFQGQIREYLPYIMRNETLKGVLKLQSAKLNANELMTLTGEEAPPADPKAEQPMAASELPANIDFSFSSDIKTLRYDNLILENARGSILLKGGILSMKGLQFNTLDGSIGMDGTYDPRNVSRPAFAYQLDMKNISVSKAYQAFKTIKTMAPVAKNIEGKFSTVFNIEGNLDKQMSPDMPSMNGGGTIRLNEGKVRDLSITKGINTLAKTNLPTEADLKDLVVKCKVKNGQVEFEPFDVKAGSQVVTISGSNGLDGTVDYRMKTSVPAGAAGAAVASALSSFTGKALSTPQNVKFEMAATGPGTSPKYRIVKVDAGDSKDQAKAAVNDKINQAKAEAEAKARAEADRLKKEAEDKAKAEAERLKKEAENKAKDEVNKLKKKLRF